MAVKDVKKYYRSLLTQYVGVKSDLEEFNDAFKNGHITEDRVASVKEEFEVIQANYERVAYIIYLLEMPQRKEKKKAYQKTNADIADGLSENNDTSIFKENESLLASIREQLKELTKNG